MIDDRPKPTATRRVILTPASAIAPRPTRWVWEDRIPIGVIALAAGRESTGKSQFTTWATAATTRGTLPGVFEGRPRAVVYAAYEDAWEQTIVPRMIAAGADLELVHRVSVEMVELDSETVLSLPADLDALEDAIAAIDAALFVVDPLLSTLHASIDTNGNREVRTVLEPLQAMADRTRCTVLGIAHFNKSNNSDPSSAIVSSGAFKDVPRAILAFARDDQTGERVMTQAKNSLGSCDLPSLAYRIVPVDIDTPEGPSHVSRLEWEGEASRTVADIMRDASGTSDDRSDRDDAAGWLVEWLDARGGSAPAKDVFTAARDEGIAERTLKRARSRAGVTFARQGFGSGSVWSLGPRSGHPGHRQEPGMNGTNEAPMELPLSSDAS